MFCQNEIACEPNIRKYAWLPATSKAIIAEPVNHIFTSTQCPFVLVVWRSPLKKKQKKKKLGKFRKTVGTGAKRCEEKGSR